MTGIYKIENLINGKVYIGQAIDIDKRWYAHKSELHFNKHQNNHLQNAWNKYGEQNFKFEVIEECLVNELNTKEQYWLNYYGGLNSSNNYNKKEAGSKGKPSNETLIKQSISHLGNKPTLETRIKMRNSHKGKIYTQTQRINISNAIKEYYKNNPEAKDRTKEIGKRNKGRKHTSEEKQKISNKLKGRENTWNKGKKLSDETRKKMSEAKKGEKHPIYGKHHTTETKNKISNKRRSL